MSEKRKRKDKVISIEELYRNKNFVPPKEKNLETIFEEPRKTKDGVPMLTSVKKFKRYLHFDTTVGKIHKRKIRAKKCVKKMKLGNLKTRSATKLEESQDISLYISEVLGESSDSEMDQEINPTDSNQSKSTVDSPEVNISDSNNQADGESLNSKSDGDESNKRISSLKPSDFEPETLSNVRHNILDAVPDSNEVAVDDEETKNISKSHCAIT